jgi:hypothetical protein
MHLIQNEATTEMIVDVIALITADSFNAERRLFEEFIAFMIGQNFFDSRNTSNIF